MALSSPVPPFSNTGQVESHDDHAGEDGMRRTRDRHRRELRRDDRVPRGRLGLEVRAEIGQFLDVSRLDSMYDACLVL